MTAASPAGGAGNGTEERAALADFIDASREEIVARWIKRTRSALKLALAATQLRNAVPDYLARLAISLRGNDPLGRGRAAWEDVAREHAVARVRLGFDIDQLVHEFILLRQVLSDVARERQATLSISQAEQLADLIEAAIASAVSSYVEARDYATRQKEAEHISFITHELRNPMSAAKLAAGRLRRSGENNRGRLLDVLERNMDRLEGLINGVLQVERFQAGKVEPRMIDVELGALMGPPLATAMMRSESKGIAVTVEYDRHLLVRADPELASSAISNVLDNAVKFTDTGTVRVAAEVTSDRVAVHVWDNCPGLSEEELRIVFEPFERGHSKKPGSGLGLAIARRALEAQNGSIGAESTGDRGCHFWFTLQRAVH
jgi:hypothetical protein